MNLADGEYTTGFAVKTGQDVLADQVAGDYRLTRTAFDAQGEHADADNLPAAQPQHRRHLRRLRPRRMGRARPRRASPADRAIGRSPATAPSPPAIAATTTSSSTASSTPSAPCSLVGDIDLVGDGLFGVAFGTRADGYDGSGDDGQDPPRRLPLHRH